MVEAAGVELFGVMITRKLLILGIAKTAKKAPLPDPLYVLRLLYENAFRGRQQNIRDLVRTFDVAVVASLQFGHLPAGGTSFSGKRLEERSRRVAFCNA